MPALPIVTIGATGLACRVAEAIADGRPVVNYPTAEAAHRGLAANDAPESGHHAVHVIYGEDWFGALPRLDGKLPHTGATLVVADRIDPDPERPRAASLDGTVGGVEPDVSAWAAGHACGAQNVVDASLLLESQAGVGTLRRTLDRKEEDLAAELAAGTAS